MKYFWSIVNTSSQIILLITSLGSQLKRKFSSIFLLMMLSKSDSPSLTSLSTTGHYIGQLLTTWILSSLLDILILILKVTIDTTGPRVLNFFSLVLYCLTVISLCTGVLSCLGSGSGYRACLANKSCNLGLGPKSIIRD